MEVWERVILNFSSISDEIKSYNEFLYLCVTNGMVCMHWINWSKQCTELLMSCLLLLGW